MFFPMRNPPLGESIEGIYVYFLGLPKTLGSKLGHWDIGFPRMKGNNGYFMRISRNIAIQWEISAGDTMKI